MWILVTYLYSCSLILWLIGEKWEGTYFLGAEKQKEFTGWKDGNILKAPVAIFNVNPYYLKSVLFWILKISKKEENFRQLKRKGMKKKENRKASNGRWCVSLCLAQTNCYSTYYRQGWRSLRSWNENLDLSWEENFTYVILFLRQILI